MRPVSGLFGWVVFLTLATGLIHAYIGVDSLLEGRAGDGIVFISMAIPYLVGLALILGGVRPLLWLRVGCRVHGLASCLVAAADGTRDTLAYADKAIEIVLLALLRGATPPPR